MSDFSPTPDPQSDPASDARLASLLDQAYETEPAPLSLARLERDWHHLRRRQRRHILAHRSLSAAAAVALVALIATITLSSHEHPAAKKNDGARVAVPEQVQPATKEGAPEGLAPSAEPGLTPTPLQQMLFTVRSRKSTSSRHDLTTLLSPYADDEVAEAEAALLGEQGLSPEVLATLLEREWKRLPDDRQPLAASLLARLGGGRSLATLRRMVRYEPLRHAVVKSLLTSGEPADVATALELAPTREVAQALLSHPQFTTDPWPLDAWLGLVYQARTRKGALAALAATNTPPVDALMAALDADEKHLRVAAAIALGELGGTEVTQRLIELVTSGNRRHAEAWLAVVQCRGPLADEFLAIAARDPLLLGHYNAAVIRQQQFAP